MDKLIPWKGRTVDVTLPVKIYRCLAPHGGRWSICQKGRVVAHADEVVLSNATFLVSAAGYRRRMRVGHKLVYAYVSGMVTDRTNGEGHGARVGLYGDSFRLSERDAPLTSAGLVVLREFMQVVHPVEKSP